MRRRPIAPTDEDPVHLCAGRGDLKTLQQMVADGQPLDEANAKGDTPLLYAVFSCHREVWTWLLDQGADIRHANAKGDTVLHHIARRFKSGDEPLDDLRTLVARGADLDAVNREGYTPLLQEAARDVASGGTKQPRMAHVEWLLEHGADPTVITRDGDTLTTLMGPEAYELIAKHRVHQASTAPTSPLRKPGRTRVRT